MKKKILIAALMLLLIPVVIYFAFPEVLYDLSVNSYRKAAGLSEKIIAADNHSIHYLEGGQGETVLLLHGFGADKDHWTRFAGKLTGRYHVVAVDLPGFGESTRVETDSYDIASQAERIDRIAAAMGLKKFHIGGNSMGGAISGRYAAQYPEKVLSLALLNTAGIHSAEKSEFIRLAAEGDNPLLVSSPEDFRRTMRFVFVQPPPIPGRITDYLTKQAVQNRAFNERIFRQIISYSLEDDFSKITAKTLVIWGDKDRILDVSSVDVIKERLPGCSSAVLENCGHLPMVERPEETAGHYLRFLDTV